MDDRWGFTWVSQGTYQITLKLPGRAEVAVALVELDEASLPEGQPLLDTQRIVTYITDALNYFDEVNHLMHFPEVSFALSATDSQG